MVLRCSGSSPKAVCVIWQLNCCFLEAGGPYLEEGGRRIVYFLLPRMGMTLGNNKQKGTGFCLVHPFH